MIRHGSLRLSMVDVEGRLGSSPGLATLIASPLPCLGHSATSPATTGGWGLIIPTLSSHSQLCRNTYFWNRQSRFSNLFLLGSFINEVIPIFQNLILLPPLVTCCALNITLNQRFCTTFIPLLIPLKNTDDRYKSILQYFNHFLGFGRISFQSWVQNLSICIKFVSKFFKNLNSRINQMMLFHL